MLRAGAHPSGCAASVKRLVLLSYLRCLLAELYKCSCMIAGLVLGPARKAHCEWRHENHACLTRGSVALVNCLLWSLPAWRSPQGVRGLCVSHSLPEVSTSVLQWGAAACRVHIDGWRVHVLMCSQQGGEGGVRVASFVGF